MIQIRSARIVTVRDAAPSQNVVFGSTGRGGACPVCTGEKVGIGRSKGCHGEILPTNGG